MDQSEARELIEQRVAELTERRSLRDIADAASRTIAATVGTGAYQTFADAVSKEGLSVIGEVSLPASEKPAGVELEECADLGYEYDAGDADAVSFVQDMRAFGASVELFKEMRDEVSTPILRHDLMIDPYQVCEAKCLGADAVTLMTCALDDDKLSKFLGVCEELAMDAMVEADSMEGLSRAVALQARIICANIPPTGAPAPTFEEIRASVPPEHLLVVASGVDSVEDARKAHAAGIDAVIAGPFLADCYKEDTIRDTIRAMKD